MGIEAPPVKHFHDPSLDGSVCERENLEHHQLEDLFWKNNVILFALSLRASLQVPDALLNMLAAIFVTQF